MGVWVTGPPQSTNWGGRVLQAISSDMIWYFVCLILEIWRYNDVHKEIIKFGSITEIILWNNSLEDVFHCTSINCWIFFIVRRRAYARIPATVHSMGITFRPAGSVIFPSVDLVVTAPTNADQSTGHSEALKSATCCQLNSSKSPLAPPESTDLFNRNRQSMFDVLQGGSNQLSRIGDVGLLPRIGWYRYILH